MRTQTQNAAHMGGVLSLVAGTRIARVPRGYAYEEKFSFQHYCIQYVYHVDYTFTHSYELGYVPSSLYTFDHVLLNMKAWLGIATSYRQRFHRI
jgi:hypothetical protein